MIITLFLMFGSIGDYTEVITYENIDQLYKYETEPRHNTPI